MSNENKQVGLDRSAKNIRKIYTELRKDLVEFADEEILPLIKDEEDDKKAKEKAFFIALKIFMIHDVRLQKELTLQEVAFVLGITRERVRQIESSAERKLKHPKFSREFRDYVFMGEATETNF